MHLLSLLSAAILGLPTTDLETLNIEISHAYIEAWSRVVSTMNAWKSPPDPRACITKRHYLRNAERIFHDLRGMVVMWSTRDRGKLEGRCDELVKGDETLAKYMYSYPRSPFPGVQVSESLRRLLGA